MSEEKKDNSSFLVIERLDMKKDMGINEEYKVGDLYAFCVEKVKGNTVYFDLKKLTKK